MKSATAMIIDFEATDVSKEAEATQLGWRNVFFDEFGELWGEPLSLERDGCYSDYVFCKPDREISYGAMAVSHITPDRVENELSHREVAEMLLPKGESYIIAHNADYDVQVAANAGVDVSQYKVICTQAMARKLMPEMDSYSLGALTYAINMDRASKHCRNAHNAGWDVTFALWLLKHLCNLGDITSMQQLYQFSEFARIPTHFDFGKHKGSAIADVARIDRNYMNWVVNNITSNPYLVDACEAALPN